MFFYGIAIKIYILFINLASPFYIKAKKAIAGRKNFFNIHQPDNSIKYIWFHCASLGEFEQGRPLIEKIKKELPDKKILLSFFSPSGYEIRKDYAFADKVVYLPFDSSSHAKKFLQAFNVEMAIFVKYDVWPYYLREILRKKIPVFLTSAVFRKDHFFFKWYGAFLRSMMAKMNKIFVQNNESKKIALDNGLLNVEVTGDVRIDRVLQIKENAVRMKDVEAFLDQKKCIIFGSAYRSDEGVITYIEKNLNDDHKIIIAPHQVDENVLNYFKQRHPRSILFKDLAEYSDQRILLIDHIGSLNQLYQYADLVYIGGGFEKGIHNILEPAVFNIPVFFGPRFEKFPEALSLIVEKLAFSDPDPTTVAKSMVMSLKEKEVKGHQERSKSWFTLNSGSTDLIFNNLCLFF